MNWEQTIITLITAILPALITYLVARNQSKTDLKKFSVQNKEDINKLMKQHEINLESLKAQHRMQMEAKEQEQEYKLQIMQKEYELKIQENQQSKSTDIMTSVLGGFATDLFSNPSTAASKITDLKNLADTLKANKSGE